VTSEGLRAHLRQRLPDYLLPSAFVIFERLPLTPNGKIDRAALAANCQPSLEEEPETIFPRTPAEELVARVWQDVLGVSPVGINNDFFSLGGHSLLATQIILRLREIFRVEVPLHAMFDAATVSGVIKAMSDLWGGREIVEEIAWIYMEVEVLSDRDVNDILAQNARLRASV
jgi:acyl carrier protein